MLKHIIYLHGFASSPGSTKANQFRPSLTAQGWSYHVPDLNVPSFEKLTLTAMLGKVAQTIDTLPDGDVALIGSSMGGLTAVNFLDRYAMQQAARVTYLVLLAPGLDFIRDSDAEWMTQWRQQGTYDFFNYAENRPLAVHYGLIEDVADYDSYATSITIPTLIYHGKHDETVSYQQSVRYAEERDGVELNILDSDHQLLDKMDEILQGIIAFFNNNG